MNTKLDNITTQYRKFNVNQALTEGQLNEFIDYFEDQDRLSRTRLSGVGIACGFKTMLMMPNGRELRPVSIDEQPLEFKYITVTQGAGVTTDGDLITLRSKIVKSKEVNIDFQATNYAYYKPYIDNYNYPQFFKGDMQMPLWELFTEEEYNDIKANGGDVTVFGEVRTMPGIEKKVVMLFLESYSNEESPCQDADCDNNGAEQVSDLKVLVADRDDVDSFMINGGRPDNIYQIHNSYEVLYNGLKDLEVQRVILNKDITTELSLRTKFQNAIQNATIVDDLDHGFTAIAQTFGINLNLGGQTLRDRLDQLLSTTADDYQYRYDLLKDLIDTYNEIRGLVLHLKAICCPSITAFSKHLLLGPVGAPLNLGDYTPFRHDFYNSPINTDADENQERLLLLANRFVQKIKDFQSFKGPIVITPSKMDVRLGKKAVPFYYNVNLSLLNKWDFDKTQIGKETYNLSYHKANLAGDDFIQNPLLYNIDDNDFFNIEGHIGKPYEIALQNINDLKAKYGLPFNVEALVLQKKSSGGGIERAVTVPVVEPSKISIKELREKLVAISSDISNQVGDTRRTLQTISGLDSQLKLLNAVEFAPSESGVSIVKQNPKENKVVSELLSEFLERKTGLEHFRGVPRGGTFYLIYESEENNEVIADFAVPYLCCSKKDPVFLALPVSKLCQNDAPIPFTIIPLDGEIKAYAGGKEITAITQSAGQNFFNPSMVSAQYFGQTITFTVDDDPVEAQMVVHAQPNVTVQVAEPVYGEVPDVPEATVAFTITGATAGMTYSINFGDGKSASGLIPAGGVISHTYSLIAGQEDTYKPTLSVTNANGCSKQYDIKPIVLVGQTTVKCLSNMEVIIQYHDKKGPCPGGHVCNSARFNLMANGVNLGLVNLNNSGAILPTQSYAEGETSGPSRMKKITISHTDAQNIVSANQPNDGFISFSLVCADSHCHTGVAWTTLKLDGVVIYNGCPRNNFLTINPCTGEVRP